jgi:hypothetical protein
MWLGRHAEARDAIVDAISSTRTLLGIDSPRSKELEQALVHLDRLIASGERNRQSDGLEV